MALCIGCSAVSDRGSAATAPVAVSAPASNTLEAAEATETSIVATRQTDTIGYVVVDEFPHDSGAFTQGLAFSGAKFYEGTGIEGESSLRLVDLPSGNVLKQKDLAAEYFGEGITVLDGLIYQITWQEHEAFVYKRKSFERIDKFTYSGEGWGLTDHDGRLIMSNGSNVIRFRKPSNFKSVRKIEVTDDGQPVNNLNELEWIKGSIYANVWQTDRIARINPANGDVTGWLDLTQIAEMERAEGNPDVLNGIAYMPGPDRLFITGKWWSHVYEIDLVNG